MNHVIHRLRPIVAPLVIIAIITQLFPALASPLTVQAKATIYNPADNIYLDFYDNAATPASECHPNYPTFGRCRSGELFNTGFTQVLPGSNPADLSKLALEPGLPTDSAKNGSLNWSHTDSSWLNRKQNSSYYWYHQLFGWSNCSYTRKSSCLPVYYFN